MRLYNNLNKRTNNGNTYKECALPEALRGVNSVIFMNMKNYKVPQC